MGFFEPLPPPAPPPQPGPQPEWLSPPENVLGGPVPLHIALFRTGDAAMIVREFTAYPTGVEFTLDVRVRRADRATNPFGHGPYGYEPGAILRFGVQFPDGSKATTPEHAPWSDIPTGPRLSQRMGGGGPLQYVMRYWLWPLPPAGTLALVAEWPALEIPETRVEIDSGALREAAALATTLWDPEPPSEGSWASVGSSFTRRVSG